LQSLYGEGTVLLLDGSLKDFGPLDKLSQSLEIAELKDIPLNNTKANFSFRSSKVIVAPFTVLAKYIEMEIGGTHGFDQSLDYNINLKMPRSQLGNKGSVFVKNVVAQAADKGIPVILRDGVSINAKMGGTINSPDVKTNMDEVVDNASTDLKNEVNDFVNAKLDSAKQQLHHPSTAANKQLYIRAAYKSKNHVKAKKISTSARKKTAHPKSKRKQKSTGRNYVTSLKKEKSTANNTRK
ncbi:MAG TPA: AsmA-like C-terminal region-containing protein, partial [Puia sp.]|nr:AsmA-like C-terminal region-containing protein [Puia sp.]